MASSISTNTLDEQLDAGAQKAVQAATRLWQQTRQMKTTILEKCRLYLKRTDANVQVLANALSTLVTFGDTPIKDVLNELLAAKLVRSSKLSAAHYDVRSLGHDQRIVPKRGHQ